MSGIRSLCLYGGSPLRIDLDEEDDDEGEAPCLRVEEDGIGVLEAYCRPDLVEGMFTVSFF